MDAHDTDVSNVLISKENSSIFSKAGDKKIKIWAMNNELTGIINFSTFKKAFWRIP